MKNVLLTLIMLLGILSCNAQSLFENEIQFNFDNLFNHESLKLRIYFYDNGTVGGEATHNYRSTTDGTYGELTIKKGENILKVGIRNFDDYKTNNLYHWISELINHLGINSKELFN